jgi:DNA-binding response OmpR family regulator
MGAKILIIDDDPEFVALFRTGLEREGFAVLCAESGRDGCLQAYRMRPDLIILDIVMPEWDGWETYRRLRQVSDAPIIMLTARASASDIAKALAIGVDDYLTKPCSFGEIKDHIQHVLEHRANQDKNKVFDDGRLRIDRTGNVRMQRGGSVRFSPTESRLLMYLASRRGQTVTREELLINVWGPDYVAEVGYLDAYIRHLQNKIEEDPEHPRYIRGRSSRGYCFSSEQVQSAVA